MSTQTPARTRPQARLWESRGRLCLAFTERTYPQWTEMVSDFRRTFVRGRRAHWLRGGQCWSVQVAQKARLYEWCECWGLTVIDGKEGSPR